MLGADQHGSLLKLVRVIPITVCFLDMPVLYIGILPTSITECTSFLLLVPFLLLVYMKFIER